MSKEKIIIANWKMKLGLKESTQLAEDMKETFKSFKKGEIAVFSRRGYETEAATPIPGFLPNR